MRIILAIKAFFAVLLGKTLGPEFALAAGESNSDQTGAQDSESSLAALQQQVNEAQTALAEQESKHRKELEQVHEEYAQKLADTTKAPSDEISHAAAVSVLAVMQSEARLLDFVSEDISDYSDDDVGAAVRDIHRGLQSAFKDHFPIQPLREEEEEASITVPEGFDPHQVRLVGNVVGEPPFAGTLSHRGWRVTKVQLPKAKTGEALYVAQAAEVEI